eukprot:2809816-Amphidinium_carterae.2
MRLDSGGIQECAHRHAGHCPLRWRSLRGVAWWASRQAIDRRVCDLCTRIFWRNNAEHKSKRYFP